ncbi:hypothetical protein Ancab_001954 [Ancistrocladus abbreviatus]
MGRPIGGRPVLLSEEKGVPLDKDVGSKTQAWVRCHGTPLRVWKDEQSEKIASVRGKFMLTDMNTKAKTRFDYSRFLMTTSSPELISCSVILLVGDKRFVIKPSEEAGGAVLMQDSLFGVDDASF